MTLSKHERRVAALAASIGEERRRAAQARTALETSIRRTARDPATLCWAFAAGALVGASDRRHTATLAGKLAGAARITSTSWSRVRTLSALLKGAA